MEASLSRFPLPTEVVLQCQVMVEGLLKHLAHPFSNGSPIKGPKMPNLQIIGQRANVIEIYTTAVVHQS